MVAPRLYLADISDEHFYQLGLRQFGTFDRMRLEPAPSLRDLLTLAVEHEEGIAENGLDPGSVVQVCRAKYVKSD